MVNPTMSNANLMAGITRGKSLLESWGITFFPTGSLPLSLSDLLQNHLSTSHTIRAHAPGPAEPQGHQDNVPVLFEYLFSRLRKMSR